MRSLPPFAGLIAICFLQLAACNRSNLDPSRLDLGWRQLDEPFALFRVAMSVMSVLAGGLLIRPLRLFRKTRCEHVAVADERRCQYADTKYEKPSCPVHRCIPR